MLLPRNKDRDSSHCCVAIANARVVTARNRPLTRSAGIPITMAARMPTAPAISTPNPKGIPAL